MSSFGQDLIAAMEEVAAHAQNKGKMAMRAIPPVAIGLIAACGENQQEAISEHSLSEWESKLAIIYNEKPKRYSRAYALVKYGAGGRDWLATIHGYPDNASVCEELVRAQFLSIR